MPDQLPLIGPRGGLNPRPRPAAPRPERDRAGRRVEVLVDSRLPHLARTFTYLLPDRIADPAAPVPVGARVRVRLAGQLTDGFVVGSAGEGFAGSVHPVEAVVSPVPVLRPEILELGRRVADHYAGTVPDVLRLAIPPRVAAAEQGWTAAPAAAVARAPDGDRNSGPVAGEFAARAAAGEAVRRVWQAPAGIDWPQEIADLAARVSAAGRGVIVVVPDARDLARVHGAMARGATPVASLSADAGPRERYAEFLRVLSGAARIVVGTRAAAFAPVTDPGLLVVWDDGDPSLAEQRAPYPHAREVLALRSHLQGAALLLAGHSRSAEAQRWLEAGWVGEIADPRSRRQRPRVFATHDQHRSPFDAVRTLPDPVVRTLRTGLADGPVLVQVARRGYVPVTACQQCRAIAECPQCAGPLAVFGDQQVTCRRCGRTRPFTCPHCGAGVLRAVRIGAHRIAEEIGRMFADVPVVVSTAEHPVVQVEPQPAVVVATPGVAPLAVGGYSSGALVDAQDDLWRTGLRAREDAARRWFDAAALLRPGAPMAVNADSADPAVQALIRWDAALLARAELARRREAGLPPARQVAQLDGAAGDIAEVLAAVAAGHELDVLGPRPADGDPQRVRALLRAHDFPAMLATVRQTLLARAAARRGSAVRVEVDPTVLD